MDDMTAFEHQIGTVLDRMGGPEPAFDAMAIANRAVTSTPTGRWSVVARRLQGRTTTPMEGGFSMFSAVKFVGAGIIVALFGGFLLSGVLTTPQGDRAIPAAASASPPPEAENNAEVETEPTISPSHTTTDELLAVFVTEELEPGVVRVVNDGVRDLEDRSGQLIAGRDGSIWLLSGKYAGKPRRLNHQFLRLGEEGLHKPPSKTFFLDLEVDPNGTVWAVTRDFKGKGAQLRSYDGDRWKVRSPAGEGANVRSVEVTSDGTVWASWGEPGTTGWRDKSLVGRVGPDAWQRIGPAADHGDDSALSITDSGEPILYRRFSYPDTAYATRYRDGAWHDMLDGFGIVAVGASGNAWLLPWHEDPEFDPSDGSLLLPPNTSAGTLLWVDGEERREWGPDDGVPVFRWLYKGWPDDLEVAPDGSLWLSYPLAPPLPAPPDCEGVARFDGETWSRFLTDHCVQEIAIADDGSVWVNGWIQDDDGNKGSPHYTYVIRPEIAVASE